MDILKGELLIQLFDAKSGRETERISGHNIITNAAHFMLNGCPHGFDRRTWGGLTTEARGEDWSDIYQKVYGGILVFSSQITESASHMFEPLTNYPVAYASMDGQDTTDPKSGTYNAVESGAVTGGYKWVYDFGTSQGNGDWACCCLTSNKAGYGYVEKKPSADANILDSYFARSNSGGLFAGATQNYVYFIANTYGSSVAVSRLKLPMFDIPLYGNNLQGAPTTIFNINADAGQRVFIDSENSKIYTLAISGNDLVVTRYDDEEDLTDTTVITLQGVGTSITIPTYNRSVIDFCVRDGYLYMGNRTRLIKVNLSDAADNDEITPVTEHVHSYSVIGASVLKTGDIYRYPDLIDANDVVHTIENGDAGSSNYSACHISQVNTWALRSRANNDAGYAATLMTNYLGTIKNLASTVRKDATKTGKISYTLTKLTTP